MSAQTVTIEVAPQVAAILEKFKARAEAQGVTLDALLHDLLPIAETGAERSGAMAEDWAEMNKQLDKLKDLTFGWDSYDAEPPNDTSFAWARKVLVALMEFNFEPTKITASVEGGIGFIFTRQDRYADIECLNSGALVAVMYDSQSEPAVWRVSPDSKSIIEALEKRGRELNVVHGSNPTRRNKSLNRASVCRLSSSGSCFNHGIHPLRS
jgi:hypothetical protein